MSFFETGWSSSSGTALELHWNCTGVARKLAKQFDFEELNWIIEVFLIVEKECPFSKWVGRFPVAVHWNRTGAARKVVNAPKTGQKLMDIEFDLMTLWSVIAITKLIAYWLFGFRLDGDWSPSIYKTLSPPSVPYCLLDVLFHDVVGWRHRPVS